MPLNVQVPAPVFSNVPLLLIIPDAVALPVPPIIAALVSVMAPDVTAGVPLLFTNEPLIVNSSAVVKPFKSTVAPDAIVVDVVVPKASLLPNFKVPALAVVTPVYVFDPINVKVPVPALVIAREVAVPF